jgi:hypothetical protein
LEKVFLAAEYEGNSSAMVKSRKTHGRYSFKNERLFTALAASLTPLDVAATDLKRSEASVRRKAAAMGISLDILKTPRPKIGTKSKGSRIAWTDVDKVEEVGEYAFRDGVIIIKRKYLDVWKRNPNATFGLVRFVTESSPPKYGLDMDNLLTGDVPK